MAKKQKKLKLVLHSVGDKYWIDGVDYMVKMTNCGKAWLGPIETSIDHRRYSFCLDRVLDAYGFLPDGSKPPRLPDYDHEEWLAHRKLGAA